MFSDIKTDLSYIKAGNMDIIGSKPDTYLNALYYTASYDEIRIDLINELKIHPYDSELRLDSVYELHSKFLDRTLTKKQLAYYYQENNDGEGSKSYDRWKYYDKGYSDDKKRFSGLLIEQEKRILS